MSYPDYQVQAALDYLRSAVEARREADSDYKRALDACAEVGITNVKMAQIAGVSETAIRTMRKRMEATDW